MEQLRYFGHRHLLHLVHMQQKKKNENSDDEEEEDEDEFVEEETQNLGKCNLCKEPIYSFQLCYYECKECADNYSLHKFCAQLPEFLNHPSHPSHHLSLYEYEYGREIRCDVCHRNKFVSFWYICTLCDFRMDIVCATISKQKMDHPSHPDHQLQRVLKPLVSGCDACGDEHKGTFYHCTTCSQFWVHLDCALLPNKLRIQHTTSGTFSHSHTLTLAYSFPHLEKQAKFHPRCRVCVKSLDKCLWLYKCDKCWYYIHVDCATSKKDVWLASLGKTSKNFEDSDHPNLLRLPFVDESDNLLKHHFFNQKHRHQLIDKTNDGDILNHASHQHPLILFDTNTSQLAADTSNISLHDPMKRHQLLCDGCLRPITTFPLYKCFSQDADQQCGFVLHKWCAHLPFKLHDHPSHPNHTLSLLMPNVPNKFFGVFVCRICKLPSNGFAYGCTTCQYFVDINCAFIPETITHEAHPNHLLSRIVMPLKGRCNACKFSMEARLGFHCRSCEFYVHTECAFLLPRMIRHKFDKRHTLDLTYGPVENHISEYFCEICEDKFDPNNWFYHCSICAESMHAACAPVILENEQYTYSYHRRCIFRFINVKFGAKLDIMDHHPHRLTFVQGIQSDGQCSRCPWKLQYRMIFKCMECTYAIDYRCAKDLS